jgi:Polyketide cyclase / dehydrase and lipid transport
MRTDSVTLHISAPPDTVYDLASDVTRMGEWSPETYRCAWIGGATGPAVGARFKAHNRRGLLRWSNSPKVLVADRGREFAFSRTNLGAGEYVWRYRLQATEGGATDVTESYEEVRPEARFVSAFVNLVFTPADERSIPQEDRRLRDRLQRSHLRKGMTETLGRVKEAAESLHTAELR